MHWIVVQGICSLSVDSYFNQKLQGLKKKTVKVTIGIVSASSEIKQYLGWNVASVETVHRNSTQQFLGQEAGNIMINWKCQGNHRWVECYYPIWYLARNQNISENLCGLVDNHSWSGLTSTSQGSVSIQQYRFCCIF